MLNTPMEDMSLEDLGVYLKHTRVRMAELEGRIKPLLEELRELQRSYSKVEQAKIEREKAALIKRGQVTYGRRKSHRATYAIDVSKLSKQERAELLAALKSMS